MKPCFRIGPAIGVAFFLSGCLSGPQTSQDMRGAAANSFFGKTTTVQVGRSIGAVNASLAAGTNKCLNRVVSSRHWSPGMYGGGHYVNISQKYSTDYNSTATTGELVMTGEYIHGPVLNKGASVGYVVDAKAVDGGTQLTIHGGKWGMKEFNDGIVSWANGGPIYCPPMPGHTT